MYRRPGVITGLTQSRPRVLLGVDGESHTFAHNESTRGFISQVARLNQSQSLEENMVQSKFANSNPFRRVRERQNSHLTSAKLNLETNPAFGILLMPKLGPIQMPVLTPSARRKNFGLETIPEDRTTLPHRATTIETQAKSRSNYTTQRASLTRLKPLRYSM